MKKLLIANIIYLPISGTNKYIAGSISGVLFINEIYTLEEIKEKHKEDKKQLFEGDDLHELCKQWGTPIHSVFLQ